MKKLKLAGLFVWLCFLQQYAQTVYTVTVTSDPLPDVAPALGQLRAAINAANANPGESIIQFNIPGTGPFTIYPTNTLPPITKTVTIDGTTQPGYDFNNPGNPMIIINGNNFLTTGLSFNSCQRSKITGLYVKNCEYGIVLTACSYMEITNNVINNISDKSVHLTSSHFNIIKGNYINVTSALVSAGQNSNEGLFLQSSNDNTIGGTGCGEGNFIGYITSEGIDNFSAPGQRNRYSGNIIFQNTFNEIYLRNTGNGGKVPPVIVTAGCDVSGTAQANNTIELFGSSGPSGSRLNAKSFMGYTKSNAIGQWSMPVSNITYPFVTATATDSINNTSELAIVKAIATDPLTLSIKTPGTICKNEKITFELVGAKCLKALTFVFDYGDGSGTGTSFDHTYALAGNYTVTVSAYDKNSCQPTVVSTTATVTACSQFDCSPCSYTLTGTGLSGTLIPAFGPSDNVINAGTLKAVAKITGGIAPYTFTWAAFNNSVPISWFPITSYPIMPIPENISGIEFANPGTGPYTATVKVTDASGCITYKTYTQ